MTQYIAADTLPDATGADIVVSSPVGVSCYGAQGSEIVGSVMKKNSDGSYDPLRSRIDPHKTPVEVKLTGIQSAFTLTKPGTYKIIKESTNGTAGIDTEV